MILNETLTMWINNSYILSDLYINICFILYVDNHRQFTLTTQNFGFIEEIEFTFMNLIKY